MIDVLEAIKVGQLGDTNPLFGNCSKEMKEIFS